MVNDPAVAGPLRFKHFMSLRYSAGGPWPTRILSQTLGAVLAYALFRLGARPNTVTLLALLTTSLGCVFLASRPADWGLAGAWLILNLGYALDCADGQLARATQASSVRGAWLDVLCDFISIVAIGVTCLYLLQDSPVSSVAAHSAGFCYLAGRCIGLFSSTMARQWRAGNAAADKANSPSWTRQLYMSIVDTPVQLTALVLAASSASALCVLMAGFGVLASIHGLFVGLTASGERDSDAH